MPRHAPGSIASSATERPTRPAHRRAARNARDRAISWLLERRQADGSWADHTDPGPFSDAIYIITLRTTGLIACSGGHEDEARVVRHLVDQANGDGIFPRHTGGPPCRQMTRCVALALRLALGDVTPDSRPPEWFAANPLLDEALQGRCRDALGRAAQLLADPPRRHAWSLGREYWVLVTVLSCHVEGHPRLPAWPLRLLASELLRVDRAGTPRAARSLGLLFRRTIPAVALIWSGALERRGLAPALDVATTVRHITEAQDDNGGWFYTAVTTGLNAMALSAAGVPATDARMIGAWRFLRGLMRSCETGGTLVETAANDLWCTAWAARTYLARPEHRATDARILPTLRLLLACQSSDGGFPFATGAGNVTDTDSTALVVRVLVEARRTACDSDEARIAEAIDAATGYLLRLQNRNGGYGAYGTTSVRGGRGPFPIAHQFLFDAPSADLTARVLEALVDAGLGPDDPPVRRALGFLLRSRCSNGLWWSRWWAGYLSATGDVLSACGRLGLSPWASRPPASPDEARWRRALERAVRFVLDHQNADGGWGETVRSDMDRRAAGVGPSNPAHTAHLLLGLLRSGCPTAHPSVQRALGYLLATVGADGGWDYPDVVFTFFARSTYYAMPQMACWVPVQALTAYLSACEADAARGARSLGRERSYVPAGATGKAEA